MATARSTPSKLRLWSLFVIALALVVAVLAGAVYADRLRVSRDIAERSEPAIVAAREIQVNLAEADAAAANAFLAGGIEDADQRRRYVDALDRAEESLTEAARHVGSDSESREAIVEMEQKVARFAGLVESARVNNRAGYPVGAAYLNAASDLLTAPEGIYTLTDVVANRAATNYRNDYNSLMTVRLVLAVIVLVAALALLFWLLRIQRFLTAAFRRRFNVGLLVGTLAAGLLCAWMGFALVAQSALLNSAREDGYGDVREYLEARALAFRAKGAESRYLIARGGETTEEFDNDAMRLSATDVAPDDDDDDVLSAIAEHTDGEVESDIASTVIARWDEYVGVHNDIVSAEQSGDRDLATTLALEDANVSFDAYADATNEGLEANRATFVDDMDAGNTVIRFLPWGGPLLAAISALAALFGIQQRINEYR